MGQAIAVRTDYAAGEVRRFAQRAKDAAQARRLLAIAAVLDGEIFYSLREARIVIESWRRHYNTIRPHASLGYKPPAPERRPLAVVR